MSIEQIHHNQDKPKPAPQLREKLKRQTEIELKLGSKKIMPELEKQLTANSIRQFLEYTNRKNYMSYREWNKAFCDKILSFDFSPLVQDKSISSEISRITVMALQMIINREIGGFTNKPNRSDSIDGKLGPYTKEMLEKYLNKITYQAAKLVAVAPEKKGGVAQSKERLKTENIFYAGDSYMEDILRGRKLKNMRALASSHLVRTKKFDTKGYRNKYIFIEDEAMKFINNPQCKSLVLNGGVNDLYSRGATQKTAKEIMDTYKRIIDAAHKKGIKITVLTLNTRKAVKTNTAYIAKTIPIANKLTLEINNWLKNKSGADTVIDTDLEINGQLSFDGLHANKKGQLALYKAIAQKTQVSQA